MMNGPYEFNSFNINYYVKESSGNFHLGILHSDRRFAPAFTGRSDHNLNVELRMKLFSYGFMYTHFTFSHTNSAEEAYLFECEKFHQFEKQLDNKEHPKFHQESLLPKVVCPLCFPEPPSSSLPL